jgi:ABC-type transporter Mla MlaB component
MYTRLQTDADSTLAYHLSGKITSDDIKGIWSEMEAAIENHDRIRLLVEIENLDHVTAPAVWEDVKHITAYVKHIERIAVVGDASWQAYFTRAAAIVPNLEAQFFARVRREEADQWIREAGE